MPCFPPKDLKSQEDTDLWLKFYHVGPILQHDPVTCLSIFVNNDIKKWELRMEHTHFFSIIIKSI